MNMSVYNQSRVPPGFRFHPTEEELLCYYLAKKATHQKIDLDVLPDIDLNKFEPWDIQEMCNIGTTPQNEWYFFNHKYKKYPTGSRMNRATAAGFWKATGRDKVVYSSSKRIGLRKTLVFYLGRAPCGRRSDWIMYEYRLDDNSHIDCACNSARVSTTEDDGWVVCRIFKKKYRQADVASPIELGTPDLSCTQMSNSSQSGFVSHEEQVQNLERALFSDPIDISFSDELLEKYFDLPVLESLNRACVLPEILDENELLNTNKSSSSMKKMIQGTKHGLIKNWVASEQLVASQPTTVHEQVEKMEQFSCYNDKDLLQDDEQCWSNF